MSEWNAAHKRIAIHYGVLQITAGATRSSGKITGGFSPAVKSGEQATALTEELLFDIIRRCDVDELKKLCDCFIDAYMSNDPDFLTSAARYYKERDVLSDQEKDIIDLYFLERCNDYHNKIETFPIKKTTIGTLECSPIVYFKE